MGVMVSEYGLLQATDGEDSAVYQLWEAWFFYYNKLVCCIRWRRAAIRAVQNRIPEVARELKRHDAVVAKELRALKGEEIDWKKPPAVIVASRARLKAVLKKYEQQLQDSYTKVDVEHNENWRNERERAAKQFKLYWGTYLKVEQAVEQADKDTYGLDKPKFAKYSDLGMTEGILAVQTKPIGNRLPGESPTQDDLFAGRIGVVWVDPVDPQAWNEQRDAKGKYIVPRGKRKKLCRTNLHMRVQTEDGKAVYTTWPMIMHRPLPEGAVIKWVVVKRWRRNNWFRWCVQFVVSVPDRIVRDNGQTVAVNLGWRKLTDGDVRCAYWVGSDGAEGELRISASNVERLAKSYAIQAVRDNDLNKLKKYLSRHKRELPGNVQKTVHLWKSAKRFRALAVSEGLPANIAKRLDKWRRRELHLWQYQTGLREGALGNRDDIYRRFAKMLAKRYSVVVVEDYSIKEIAEKPDRKKKPSRQRHETGTYKLRQSLINTARREGSVPVAGVSWKATQMCAGCGYGENAGEEWDASPTICHTCERCGVTFDQDQNNALNMLRRAVEMIMSDPTLIVPDAPKKGGRFANKGKKPQ